MGVHVTCAEKAPKTSKHPPGSPATRRIAGSLPTASSFPPTTDSRARSSTTRSNLNNSVGYADPARFANPVALGTDGIGAHMIETFRLAYALQRSVDITASPETAWRWLQAGWDLVPEARGDRVAWFYEPMDPWHVAFTPGIQPLRVEVDGVVVWEDGHPTRVDAAEVRAKAREQAARLHARL